MTANNGAVQDSSLQERVINDANSLLRQLTMLSEFSITKQNNHPATIAIRSPFHYIYSEQQRDIFIDKFVQATQVLARSARTYKCLIVGAGVNPYFTDSSEQPLALCSDIHQIEVLDDGEVERTYNLFRQFLPELLALSANSSVYGRTIQRDFSARMRVNPSSFLPRYISQFSAEHLRRLERMMRKDYGLRDLREMDINPLVGNLSAEYSSGERPAVEIRFVDAQCSYAFIRAQIILFQAIAIYGRTLSRKGKRLPYMRDEVIDENKALAIKGGASAVLKADSKFAKSNAKQGYWYHDRGKANEQPLPCCL
ncbi:MAG: hypothetical protein R3E39_30620 [Anaerolineae bacterium]